MHGPTLIRGREREGQYCAIKLEFLRGGDQEENKVEGNFKGGSRGEGNNE